MDVLPTSAVLDIPPEATASEIAIRLGVRFVIFGAIQTSKGQWRLSVEMFAHAACESPCGRGHFRNVHACPNEALENIRSEMTRSS